MHNALTDNYFVVSLVYSASLRKGGGGSANTACILARLVPPKVVGPWTVAPLAQWIIRHCLRNVVIITFIAVHKPFI